MVAQRIGKDNLAHNHPITELYGFSHLKDNYQPDDVKEMSFSTKHAINQTAQGGKASMMSQTNSCVLLFFLFKFSTTKEFLVINRGGSRGGSLGSGDPPFQEVSYS